MSRVRALIVIAILGSAAAFAQTGAEHFARAIRLHQAGDLPAAIAEYQACLKLEPGRVDALSNLGAALVKLNRYSEAIEQYRQALHVSSGDPRIRMNLAIAYYKSDRLAEAVGELSRLQQSSAANEQTLMLLSDCYFRLGQNRKVVELLRPAAASSSNNRAILYLLGTALIRDNQIAEGQALIEQLLREGESAETQLLVGTTQLMNGQYAEAQKLLERAVSLNPELPEVFAYYGMALMKAGDAEAAGAAFRQQLARDPGNYAANLNLGSLLRAQGKLAEAMPLLLRAKTIRPQAEEAQIELGKAYGAAKRWPEAAAELEAAAREHPESVETHRALADLYGHLRRPADRDAQRAMAQRLEGQDQGNPAIEKLHREIMEKLKAAK